MPNYPYVSGPAGVLAAFAQLRIGFPPKVYAGYLKRFQIAPSNESYVISILRFLGLSHWSIMSPAAPCSGEQQAARRDICTVDSGADRSPGPDSI